uniref:Kinesin-like protein n=1 Tax=Palpitomonas bilix TaxID=652834 RepID=A0A7S3LVQ8_9EUKA|mmetsp:Transcript_50490/g.130140  ORF Transcript_50490/g.130140 Transcript_50490/m.130140 type:complete len:901 (+) Transcript_50490:98-2800(+)
MSRQRGKTFASSLSSVTEELAGGGTAGSSDVSPTFVPPPLKRRNSVTGRRGSVSIVSTTRDLPTNISVSLRVRPVDEEDLGEDGDAALEGWWIDEHAIQAHANRYPTSLFDDVYLEDSSNQRLFEKFATPSILAALNGYNATIFAYGQTAAGKTHSIVGTKDDPGILPLSVEQIFRHVQNDKARSYLLRISYVELYNEELIDLLGEGEDEEGQDTRKKLRIADDLIRGPYVDGLTETVVYNLDEVMRVISQGLERRHISATMMNTRSSRSHVIFQMKLESSGKGGRGPSTVSMLNIVDLAGSERYYADAQEGRHKEGMNINKSLLTLGMITRKLSENKPGAHVPYRDSKLTRILQSSLGGNARTSFLCCVNPLKKCSEETNLTIQFGLTARKVQNQARVNELVDEESLIQQYRNEIIELRKTLEENPTVEKEELERLREQKKSHEDMINGLELRVHKLSQMVLSASLAGRKDAADSPQQRSRRASMADAGSKEAETPQSAPPMRRARRPSLTGLEDIKKAMAVASADGHEIEPLGGKDGVKMMKLEAALSERHHEVLTLRDQIEAFKSFHRDEEKRRVEQEDELNTQMAVMEDELDSVKVTLEKLEQERDEMKKRYEEEKKKKEEAEARLVKLRQEFITTRSSATNEKERIAADLSEKEMSLVELGDQVKKLEEEVQHEKKEREKVVEYSTKAVKRALSMVEMSKKSSEQNLRDTTFMMEAHVVATQARQAETQSSQDIISGLREEVSKLQRERREHEKELRLYRIAERYNGRMRMRGDGERDGDGMNGSHTGLALQNGGDGEGKEEEEEGQAEARQFFSLVDDLHNVMAKLKAGKRHPPRLTHSASSPNVYSNGSSKKGAEKKGGGGSGVGGTLKRELHMLSKQLNLTLKYLKRGLGYE